MCKAKRLIDDFRRQDKATVWRHLGALAVNYAVYSTHLKGLPPFLTDYDIYLYCDATSVVIVCLECCGHGADTVYTESEPLSPLIFVEGREPRVSTVWKLSEAVRTAKRLLQQGNPGISVYGVLLTEAGILNAYAMERLWDSHDIKVIDSFVRLRGRRAQVNDDDELACKDYVRIMIEASQNVPAESAPVAAAATGTTRKDDAGTLDEDEFAKMLQAFIHEELESTDDTDGNDGTAADGLADSGSSPLDTELFPDGLIEQNQNLSVTVEILRPTDNPRQELDCLVGCSDIKRRMDELLALTRYNQMMSELFPNGKRHEVSLHSLFLGRPGTGKTTVCRIFGSLLRQAGVLSKGHVVVCDRGTFIGTLWGDEERSVKQVLELAKGGVLMIDEAYLLNSKNAHDPGRIVVQLLMNVLADEKQRDIAVVLCGYKEPMMRLMDTNPGLHSRFPNRFEFTDFTVDELLEIAKRRIKDYGYLFTPQAWEKFCAVIEQAYQTRDPETWGNARFVANQLERIYIRHAERCVRQQPDHKSELLMLTPEDIVPIDTPRQKTKIGF